MSGCTLLKYLNEVSRQIQSTDTWQTIEYQMFNLGMRPLDVTKNFLAMQLVPHMPCVSTITIPVHSFDTPAIVNSRLENQPGIVENTVLLLETLDIESTNHETGNTSAIGAQ